MKKLKKIKIISILLIFISIIYSIGIYNHSFVFAGKSTNPYEKYFNQSTVIKLKIITLKIKLKKNKLSQIEYNNYLQTFEYNLQTIKNKYSNHTSIKKLVNYLTYETTKLYITNTELGEKFPFGILTGFYPEKRSKEIDKKNIGEWNFSTNDDPSFSTIQDIGINWDRSTHPIIDWSYVQKTKEMIINDEYNWEISDNYIKKLPININYLVTIYAGSKAIPTGQWEFVNPKLKEKYSEFIRKVVERYDGDGIDDMPNLISPVKYWQIENEPISYINFNSTDRKPNYDYKGYSKLLKIAYESIKISDSTAKVLSAGIVSAPDRKNTELIEEFWTPLIEELNGEYIDIFDFHWFKEWEKIEEQYSLIRDLLDENGFESTDIWITENGSSSEGGEKEQAGDLVKRMFFPLSLGIKKSFWAWGLVEGWPPFKCDSMFDHTGLIYDGYCDNDLGYGVKKLSYYSYKMLSIKIQEYGFENIEKINDKQDVYIYKISNSNKQFWIAWTKSNTSSLSLENLGITEAKITEAVPNYENGKELIDNNIDYSDMFKTYTQSNIIQITSTPIYIEKND